MKTLRFLTLMLTALSMGAAFAHLLGVGFRPEADV